MKMLVMIDSAHAVHKNMRGHTGSITTFRTGVIDQKSSMQKMNTRSSTEAEHVGTSEYLPKPIFFELFMNHELNGKCESIQSMIFVGCSS